MYPSDPEETTPRGPRDIDECEASAEDYARLGWIPELADALSAGDLYRASLLDNLRTHEQRDLRVRLAARGLCLITEDGTVYVERIADEVRS